MNWPHDWNPVIGPVDLEPIQKFHQWYHRAVSADLELPEKAALATADADGRPSVRYVLVRAYDERGLVFFTNYQSRKGRDLAANPVAALAFHWVQLGLQVRIEGSIEKVEPDLSDRYFASRPAGNRAAAIVSPQSDEVASYEQLHRDLDQLLEQGDQALARPDYWGGYRLQPDQFEFWTNRDHRLHERECWRLHEGNWQHSLLSP